MKFDALFSAITEHGVVKETPLLYEDFPLGDKATITKVIEMYITFDVNLGDIHDQLLVSLANSLGANKLKAMVEEEKIRKQDLEKIEVTLTPEERIRFFEITRKIIQDQT